MNRRELKDALGTLHQKLPESIEHQLIGERSLRGITCPCCGHKSWTGLNHSQLVERLIEDNGFLCYHCLNSGTPITKNSRVASVIFNSKQTIIGIMRQTGFVNFNECLTYSERAKNKAWYEYISIELINGVEKIVLTLPEGDKAHAYTLRQWTERLNTKRRQNGPLNLDSKLSDSEHLSRLHTVHPNGRFVNLAPSREVSQVNCGHVSKNIGLELHHPDFFISTNKMKAAIDKKGKDTSFCPICADEKGKPIPRTEKTLEIANVLWKSRAIRFSRFIPVDSLDNCSVAYTSDSDEELGISKAKLVFQCHNPDHEPIIDTYDNRFKKVRVGYCKQCLSSAGFKNFKALEDASN